MKFKVITLFPELFSSFSEVGVVGQAIRRNEVSLQYVNPRDFTTDRHRTVDDRPFGGGPGMVMLAEPLSQAVKSVKTENSKTIYLSAQGRLFNSKIAEEYSKVEDIILICGRYEGVDERFISQYVDDQLSIGDYVISGGELAAMVMVDSISRFRKGVLGNFESVLQESFMSGLLEGPQFTRPASFQGLDVPLVLTSGNHESIRKWRELISLLKTKTLRPDLWGKIKVPDKLWNEAMDLFNKMSDAEKRACGLDVRDEPSFANTRPNFKQ